MDYFVIHMSIVSVLVEVLVITFPFHVYGEILLIPTVHISTTYNYY